MIHSRIEPDLVHNDDPSLLDLVLERTDGGADIARRHDVRLPLNRGLDNVNVVDVRDERDDKVMLGDGALEGSTLLGVAGACVERDGSRVAEIANERFGTGKRATCWGTSAKFARR